MSATTKETIQATADEIGLSMTTKFIPWSESRNKGEKMPSLNWSVTILRNGRAFLTVDYSAGCGHCPSYKQSTWEKRSVETDERVRSECETGMSKTRESSFHKGKSILPSLADVLSSLATDAEAMDYGDFESWADSFGYDADSRSAETIYRACLETGLKLRKALGEDGLAKLREAVRDY